MKYFLIFIYSYSFNDTVSVALSVNVGRNILCCIFVNLSLLLIQYFYKKEIEMLTCFTSE